jgi:RNA polymerase sigma factor (sigma-70 family)
MADSRIAALLRGLGSPEPEPAWNLFLELYSGLVSQVVCWFEHGDDESADCFVYVCEQLSRSQFRRLRRFNPDGAASFPTWLRAVVRNLCVDWQRQRAGRYRSFHSVTRLTTFDQEVFHHIWEQNQSVDQCTVALQRNFPATSPEDVEASVERVQNSLSPRQQWLLSSRRTRIESLTQDCDGERIPEREIKDSSPDPELQAAFKEEIDGLHRAIAQLPYSDRILLQLRFEQGLSLAEVARLLSLKNPAAAFRQIEEALTRLRGLFGIRTKVVEKTASRSV